MMAVIAGCITAGSYAQSEALGKAVQAYRNYDFEEAQRLVNAAKGKTKKGSAELEDLNDLSAQISVARNFLERVEHLEILDSLAVPKTDFFRHYRLPASAGKLGAPENSESDYLFTNENGDYRIWSQPDSVGTRVLVESNRLTDGSWSEPQMIEDLVEEGRDAAYPFMMADGVTLYYALKNADGLGGYDIMVATRDASDGSFLKPQNLGMPYNSPYDDYLLAIDELNGVGWFATDRNNLGDDVTIYLFKVNERRNNYDEDTEDLEDRALLRDWRLTRDPDADYAELLEAVQAIQPASEEEEADFHLPMDNGVTYTSYDDFRSDRAAELMEQYVDDLEEYENMRERLSASRKEYHQNPSPQLKTQIRQLEQECSKRKKSLRRQLSDIYREERT